MELIAPAVSLAEKEANRLFRYDFTSIETFAGTDSFLILSTKISAWFVVFALSVMFGLLVVFTMSVIFATSVAFDV